MSSFTCVRLAFLSTLHQLHPTSRFQVKEQQRVTLQRTEVENTQREDTDRKEYSYTSLKLDIVQILFIQLTMKIHTYSLPHTGTKLLSNYRQ